LSPVTTVNDSVAAGLNLIINFSGPEVNVDVYPNINMKPK